MKKTVEQLRHLCKHIQDVKKMHSAMSLLDDIDRWADAQFALEELDALSESLNGQIIRLTANVKMYSTLSEVLEMSRESLGIPDHIEIDKSALEELKTIIQELEQRKERCDRLRTLYTIDKMTEIPE